MSSERADQIHRPCAWHKVAVRRVRGCNDGQSENSSSVWRATAVLVYYQDHLCRARAVAFAKCASIWCGIDGEKLLHPSLGSGISAITPSFTWCRRKELLVKVHLVAPGNDDGHRLHATVAKLEQSGDLARHDVAAVQHTHGSFGCVLGALTNRRAW